MDAASPSQTLLAEAHKAAAAVYNSSEAARIKLDMVLASPYIPVEPTPKQALALMDSRYELLYGGAVGGGKSAYLLMEALAFAHAPRSSSLILRRELPMLEMEGGLIELAHEWLDGTDARWNEQKKRWTFPRRGKLAFGYLDAPAHLIRYKGPAFHFVGFDELTDWRERSWYLFFVTRMRKRLGTAIPLRLRSTTNPDGPGLDWVKNRFVDATDPARGYLFASIYENPYLDHGEYIDNMRRVLSDDAIARLIEGSWDARPPGELFRREMFEQLDRLPDGVSIVAEVRSWDQAASESDKADWTVGTRIGRDQLGGFWIRDVVRAKLRPTERDALILRTAERDGRAVKVVITSDPGQAGVSLADAQVRMLAGYVVEVVRETGSKWTRAQPLASQAGRPGNVRLIRGAWVEEWLDEMEQFREDEGQAHDDRVDSASTGFNVLAATRRSALPPRPREPRGNAIAY